MKKIIALLLAVIMVMGLATVASAETGTATDATNDYTASLNKDTKFVKAYKVNNGKAPAETFYFKAPVLTKFVDQNEAVATTLPTVYPTVTLGTAVFDEKVKADDAYKADVSVAITNLNACALGVYTYKIEEDAKNTAGVEYVATPVYLNVTVLRDEDNGKNYVAAIHYSEAMDSNDKIGETTNQYNAGQLTITKNITGNMADLSKAFPFTIVLTAPKGEVINSTIEYSVAGGAAQTVVPKANTCTITGSIAAGQSIVITNIPEGVTYTITEDKGNYTQVELTGEAVDMEKGEVTGTIDANDKDAAAFTNNLASNVDTGIVMDSVPFIVMAVVAVIGLAAFTAKKRVQE